MIIGTKVGFLLYCCFFHIFLQTHCFIYMLTSFPSYSLMMAMPNASCAWCSKLPPCTSYSIPTDQWQQVELRASLILQLPSNSLRPTPCCVSHLLYCEFLVACSVAQQATGSVQFQFPRKTKQSNFLLLQFELVFLVHACNLALQLPLPFP